MDQSIEHKHAQAEKPVEKKLASWITIGAGEFIHDGGSNGWVASKDLVNSAPRQWVGLTDDEWQELSDETELVIPGPLKVAIEAKLKAKNAL